MPVNFLTTIQRQQFDSFPETIDKELIIKYFTLSEIDLSIIPFTSSGYIRMGFSLLLCALRFLGFFPDDLSTTPDECINFLKQQLTLNSTIDLKQYGQRSQTRTDHQNIIEYMLFQPKQLMKRKVIKYSLAALLIKS